MKLVQQFAPYVFLVIVLAIAAYVAFRAHQNDQLALLSDEELEVESYWAAQDGKINNKYRREIEYRAGLARRTAAAALAAAAEDAEEATLPARA